MGSDLATDTPLMHRWDTLNNSGGLTTCGKFFPVTNWQHWIAEGTSNDLLVTCPDCRQQARLQP